MVGSLPLPVLEDKPRIPHSQMLPDYQASRSLHDSVSLFGFYGDLMLACEQQQRVLFCFLAARPYS